MIKRGGCSFNQVIGIDYSGAGCPEDRLPGLQACIARPGHSPRLWLPPVQDTRKRRARWSRRGLAEALLQHLETSAPTLIGIDHALGFPQSYLDRFGLRTWQTFLEDFLAHWPADRPGVSVESLRRENPRCGQGSEYRLCERWTAGAKSVFQFDVQGSVAKSTHAGLPWVASLKATLGSRLHLWPMEGFSPPAGKHVIAEVFPSLFRRRYPAEDRTADEHDAWAVACWLSERCVRDDLALYLNPPLDPMQSAQVQREGWILGVV